MQWKEHWKKGVDNCTLIFPLNDVKQEVEKVLLRTLFQTWKNIAGAISFWMQIKFQASPRELYMY